MFELHCHTTASDGALAPEELVRLALERGLTHLAITDHDTTAGLEPARRAAAGTPLEILSGIELSCYAAGREIHVLGYRFCESDQRLQATLERMRRARVDRMHAMLERLRAQGIDIPFEQVRAASGAESIGRPHLARAMVEAGHARDCDEVFDNFIGNGKPAYVARQDLSPAEAVACLRGAGGLAVLAHPGLVRDNNLVVELLEAGFQGLEVFHPAHSRRCVRRYGRLARSRGLLATGGTDFHSPEARDKPLLGSMRVPCEVLQTLSQVTPSDA